MSDEETPTNIDEILPSLKKNKELPFVESENLMALSVPIETRGSIKRVDPKLIISAPNMKSWQDVDRSPRYIEKMVRDIKNHSLNLDDIEPPTLFEYGGAYVINSDGRTRIAVAKLLGLQDIRAEVSPAKPNTAVAFSQTDFELLKSRLEWGLWRGTIEQDLSGVTKSWGGDFYASGKISYFDSVCVFSRDMELVKSIYQKVGATGKPSF